MEQQKEYIYEYMANGLFKAGDCDKANKVIICDEEMVPEYRKAYQIKSHGNLLFDQIKQAYPDVPLLEIICRMNFSRLQSKDAYDRLKNYSNGFQITVRKKTCRFIPFVKSNSMSKDSLVFYINSEYAEKIKERIFLGFDQYQSDISKWFAYTGCSCSDCTICSSVDLNVNNTAIVPDLTMFGYSKECITAISIPFLMNKLEEIKKILVESFSDSTLTYSKLKERITDMHLSNLSFDERDIYSHLQNMECYKNSPDFSKISKDENSLFIANLIDDVNKVINLPFKDLLIEIRNIKEKYSKENYNRNRIIWKKVLVKKYLVDFNMFDGEGIISNELCDSINNDLNKGRRINSLQIRLPFTKGVVHSCDFKSFFKSKGVDFIYGLTYNKENKLRKYNVDDLDMILTESVFKASKYLKCIKDDNPILKVDGCKLTQIDYYFHQLKKYNYHLGISKLEHENSDKERLNSQVISTLPLDEKTIEKLTGGTINHIRETSDYDICNSDTSYVVKEFQELNGNKDCLDAYLFKNAKDFYIRTKHYKDKRNEILEKRIGKAVTGGLVISGSRRFLSGDLLSLLYHLIPDELNIKLPAENRIENRSFYMPNDNEKAENGYNILLRNPHYSRNEIVISYCYKSGSKKEDAERDLYFSHLTGIIMINPLSQAADKLGGADYDGDEIIIVAHRNVVKCVNEFFKNKKNENGRESAYPPVRIPSINSSKCDVREYHAIIECFQKTFSNETGLISNKAFNYSFNAYHGLSSSNDIDDSMAFFTILGGLEIDSQKNGMKPELTIRDEEGKLVKDPEEQLLLAIKTELKNKNDIPKDKLQYPIRSQALQDALIANANRNYIYKFMADINDPASKYLCPIKAEKHQYFLEDITDQETLVSAIGIFNGISRIKQDYYAQKSKRKDPKKEKDAIKERISRILNKNIGDDSLLESLLKDSETAIPYDTLERYINLDEKYHFLKDDRKKNETISALGLSLSNEEIKALSQFENNGFSLLFLCLLYWTYNKPVYKDKNEEYYLNELSKFLEKREISLSDKEINKIKDISEHVFKIYTNGLLKDTYDIAYGNSIVEVKEYIKAQYPKMRLTDFAHITDLYECSYVFDFLEDLTFAYFAAKKEVNDENNK